MEIGKNEIETMTSTLESWQGNMIRITKEEQGDYDHTKMEFRNYALEGNEHPMDDYISALTLQLTGTGTTTIANKDVELPYSLYDIPLDEVYEVNVTQDQLNIRTSRGTYSISLH